MSIRERPAAVEDRAVPGYWEGDLLSGSRNSYIATLVERHTRYVMLMKIANKNTQTVISALVKQAKTLITVSIGLSCNKFLAKIASDLDKPRGFAVLSAAEAPSFLAPKPVASFSASAK